MVIITFQDKIRKDRLKHLMVHISPDGKVVHCFILRDLTADFTLCRPHEPFASDNYHIAFLTKCLLFSQVVLPSLADHLALTKNI